jgi:hypothetical protein
MTLKEKFRDLDSMNWRNNDNEKIADDFAIGFMEWCQYEMPIEYFTYHTSIALLEIYKKEKGL